MAVTPKKFLDQAGLERFARNYPTNDTISAIVNAIDAELNSKQNKAFDVVYSIDNNNNITSTKTYAQTTALISSAIANNSNVLGLIIYKNQLLITNLNFGLFSDHLIASGIVDNIIITITHTEANVLSFTYTENHIPTDMSDLTDIQGRIPTNVSDLPNDAGYLTSYTETDPTVPAWAKAVSKPAYTASEVGALPDTTTIPSDVSDLTDNNGLLVHFSGDYTDLTNKPINVSAFTNDAGYLTSHQDISGKADLASPAFTGTPTAPTATTGTNTTQVATTEFVQRAMTNATAIPFGTVDSTSTATVMTATVPGVTELFDGMCCYIMNGIVTSASGFTLNVNNLGAKPVYQTLAAATRSTTIFNINYTMLFVYNSRRVTGGCWDVFYGYNSDTNTIAYNVRLGQTVNVLATSLTRYKIIFTMANGKLLPSTTVSNNTGTSKALTTESFDPFGNIYYYATTSSIAANGAASSSYTYIMHNSIDLRYSFNTGDTLTAYLPVYVRAVLQSDGTVKLDGNDCIVQTLPSAVDGKLYIKLGFAYNTTSIVLELKHPIYEFKNGEIREWQGYNVDIVATENSTNLITSGGVYAGLAAYAPLASPALTGVPTAPTATAGTSTTQLATTAFVQGAVATAAAGLIKREVVNTLPTQNIDTNTIYMIAKLTALNDNAYNEFMYINNHWELIGDTTVDLSDYLQSSDIAAWAKAANKPTYTASEVGALPANTSIPSDVSDLTDNNNLLFSGSYNDLTNIPDDKVYIINVTLTSLTAGTSDKSPSDISTAIAAGKIPIVSTAYGLNSMLAFLTYCNGGEAVFIYNNLAASDSTAGSMIGRMTINSSKKVSITWVNYAKLASPAFTGTPTAPTAASGTNTTQIATTAFVQAALPTVPDDISDLTDTNNLLFSGNYNDLTNKPTIDTTITQNSTNAISSGAVYTALGNIEAALGALL